MIASFRLASPSTRCCALLTWRGRRTGYHVSDDVHFVDAIKVTFRFVAMQFPAGLTIALAIALLLNSHVWETFFRTMFYMPAIAFRSDGPPLGLDPESMIMDWPTT